MDLLSRLLLSSLLIQDEDYFLFWPGWVQGNSDGPLVLMVPLVPIEKDVIPMVLLVNMHCIKGTGWVSKSELAFKDGL